MVEVSSIRAVLFVSDVGRVSSFYSDVLGMTCVANDEGYAALNGGGFELIVHQIPKHASDGIEVQRPPLRRTGGALRLDYPVEDIARSRALAKTMGGGIDEAPPPWADRDTNFYLGFDPEGNVFGVSQVR